MKPTPKLLMCGRFFMSGCVQCTVGLPSWRPQHLFVDPRNLCAIGDEEKKKRSLQGVVSFLSMAAPPIEKTSGSPTAAMDTEDDASPPGDNPSPTNTSPSSPTSIPQCVNHPALPPLGPGSPDHSSIDTDSVDTSEVPPRTPSLFPGDTGSNQPSNVPPPIHPSRNPSVLPSSNTLSPGTMPSPGTTLSPGAAPTQPPLPSAGNGAFDLTGIPGDFIPESIRTYWESVPGGEKWVEMVKSYLTLQTMPPSKDVRILMLYYFATNSTSSSSSGFQRHPGQKSCKPG